MADSTETVSVDGTEYTIRTRLAWLEQQRIDTLAFKLFVEGRAFANTDDISEIEELEIRMDTAYHNLARLRARLVDVKRADVLDLPAGHVAVLIERIEELEQEEKAEIEALKTGNPTAIP